VINRTVAGVTKTPQRIADCFLENLARPLAIETLFGKSLGVPFAAVGGHQITSINVDRGGEFGRRVGDRMDNVFTERHRVFHAQRAGGRGFELPLSGLSDRRQKMLSSRPP